MRVFSRRFALFRNLIWHLIRLRGVAYWLLTRLSILNISTSTAVAPQAPLRIALCGYRSHPYVGGQGVYLHYLSKALVQLGHQVDVISGPPYPELDERVNLVKLESLDLFARADQGQALEKEFFSNWPNFIEWWAKLTGGFAEPYTFTLRLKKYLADNPNRYDVLHDNQSLGWGLLDIERSGLPVVATIHHPIMRDLSLAMAAAQDWKARWLLRRWYGFLKMQKAVGKKLSNVVTVSENSKVDIAKDFERSPESIGMILNGVDSQVFRPLPNTPRTPNQLITTASSDQPLKGLKYLLLAVAELRQNNPDLRLTVIGRLKPNGDTERLIKRLNLIEQVNFVSGLSTEQIVELYAQSSIAVVPSLYEGFGLPAAEAMACECPVISTNGGALPEVVGDAGLVVEAKSAQALAVAIEDLLVDDDKRKQLALAGRERMLKHFSWETAAQNYVDLYRSLLSDSKQSSWLDQQASAMQEPLNDNTPLDA